MASLDEKIKEIVLETLLELVNDLEEKDQEVSCYTLILAIKARLAWF